MTLPYNGSVSTTSPALFIGNTGNGDGIQAGTNSDYSGVAGINDGFGNGVYARSAGGNALYGEANGFGSGAYGSSISGFGVYGYSTNTDGLHGVGATGVHGESSTGLGVYGYSTAFDGVQGQTGSSNFAGVSGFGGWYGVYAAGTVRGVYGVSTGGGFAMWADGAMEVVGDLYVDGSKDFAEPHPSDPSKEIHFTSLEGPESGTYFRGTAHLVHGHATIDIPDTFKIVSAADRLTVQLTAVGEAATLYCVTRSLDGIEIAGSPDVEFDYQVNGVRKAFADSKPLRENKLFVPDSPDASQLIAHLPAESVARMVSNGTLNADHTVNMATVHRLGWDQRSGWTDTPKRRPEPPHSSPPAPTGTN